MQYNPKAERKREREGVGWVKWGGERHGGVKITERKRHKKGENIGDIYHLH